jgi:hypothetical protein
VILYSISSVTKKHFTLLVIFQNSTTLLDTYKSYGMCLQKNQLTS